MLGAPESGFINQVWRALGGQRALIDMVTPFGIAWVMALFEGSVAFFMIGAVMKSMDPSLEEASQVMGASRLRTMLRVTLPLVAPGVLGADDLRVCRDARLVHRRAGARLAQPLLRGHHGDLPAGLAISAAPAAGRGDGRVAVRDHVRDDVHLPPHRHLAQLRHRHRQGVPPARAWTWAAALGAVRRLRALCPAVGRAAAADAGVRLAAEDRRRVSRRRRTGPWRTTAAR